MSTGVAFFFCQYKHSQTQQPIHILTTLAAQLARQNSDAYEILERYYKELQPEKGVSTDPTNWMTRGVVEKMIACFGSVYVVIDGVDECDESTADVVSMLTAIPDASSNVSICVLSRDEQEIRQALAESFLHIDIQAQSEDVNLYVAAEIDARIRRNQLRLKNMALKDEILHALVQNHGGM